MQYYVIVYAGGYKGMPRPWSEMLRQLSASLRGEWPCRDMPSVVRVEHF